MIPLWAEALLVVFSYTLTVSFLAISVLASGGRWMYGNNLMLRRRWTEKILQKEADALLGVQTYRNVIMSSSFLATAVLAVASFFLAAVMNQEEKDTITSIAIQDPLVSINPETGQANISATVKLLIIFTICFISFFFMTQSIRLHMHLGFAMKADSGTDVPSSLRGRTLKNAIVGQSYFAFGLRVFYLLFPSVMWLVGTTWLIVSSVLTTVSLFVFDTNHKDWGKRYMTAEEFNDPEVQVS